MFHIPATHSSGRQSFRELTAGSCGPVPIGVCKQIAQISESDLRLRVVCTCKKTGMQQACLSLLRLVTQQSHADSQSCMNPIQPETWQLCHNANPNKTQIPQWFLIFREVLSSFICLFSHLWLFIIDDWYRNFKYHTSYSKAANRNYLLMNNPEFSRYKIRDYFVSKYCLYSNHTRRSWTLLNTVKSRNTDYTDLPLLI